MRYGDKHLKQLSFVIYSILLISLCNVKICRASENADKPIRVRIFSFKNISAEEAGKYLSDIGIGDTVLVIPGTSAISVAAKPEELVFASSVAKMVDSKIVYGIKATETTEDEILPNIEKIQAELGNAFSIGSLMSGTTGTKVNKVIVDYFKGKQIIIAPAEHLEMIAEAVERLKKTAAQEKKEKEEKIKAETTVPIIETAATETAATVESVNDITFFEEPVVIEAGEKAVENIQTEEQKTKQNKISENDDDDMLDGLLDELAVEAAKEKTATKKIDIVEPNVITEDINVEPDIITENINVEPEVIEATEKTSEPPKTEPIQEAIEEHIEEQQKPPAEENLKDNVTDKIQKPVAKTEKQPEVKETQKEIETKIEPTKVEQEKFVFSELEIPNGDEILELNLPEKVDVVALIDLVGKYLNLNYLYDENKVKGNVTIKVQGKIRVRELYNLLESVLKFKGFVMSRKDNLVTIVPTAEAMEQDPTFVSGGIKPGDVIVTNVFQLKHISTMAARGLLSQMRLGSNITELPETSTLVVTEYAFRMTRIEKLLKLVDVKGTPKTFKLRVLKYTLAEALVPKIKALSEQLGTVEVTIGASVPAQPIPNPRARRRPPPAPAPTQSPNVAKKGVYIDFDKRTNRVLIIGVADEIAAVEHIIDSLDVPQQDLRIIREYEIQYLDVEEVVSALKDLGILDAADSSAGKPKPSTKGKPPVPSTSGVTDLASIDQPQIVQLETTNSLLVNATPEQHIQIMRIISYVDREPIEAAIPYRIYRLENQEPEALAEVLNNLIEKTIKDEKGKIQKKVTREEDIAVVADEATFSLIVYASKKNQEWLGNLITTLDKRRPQVLIDVSLVEIKRNEDFEYDLSIVANAKNLATGNIGVTGSQLITTAAGALLEGGYNLTDATGANQKSVKGFYNDGKIQALLKLIDTKGYGRVLAQPKVLVNDNEEGLIQTSQKTHVEETTTHHPENAAPYDTSEWKPYEAKIELQITPQISEGELLRLEIEMIREDFVETLKGPPDYTTSTVNTVVTVPDGSTIILGGLTKLNQTKSGSKVPLLGDVPLVGSLFRSVDNANDERMLYIFVKANILRPDMTEGLKQLTQISEKNREQFEKFEEEFQRHESFPGVKPEPVRPVRVLDDIASAKDKAEPDVLEVLAQTK